MKRALLLALLAACQDTSIVVGDLQEVTSLPVVPNRNLDILFVVDNSGSMIEQQQSLAANFGRMMDVLEQLDGPLPNLHIGVVTSDMGTSSATQPPGPAVGTVGAGGCAAIGDNGALRGSPQIAGTFITDIELSDGSRAKNYSGELRDVFGEIALAGATGCGFEQHLSAMRAALGNPGNAGFLRADANLAVVIIADEDDCSALDASVFSPDTTTFGTLTSFRCTRFGVQCDPDDMLTPGTKLDCQPRTSSTIIEDVQPFVDALVAAKGDARKVMVAAIVGDPAPVVVDNLNIQGTLQPALLPSCTFAGPNGEEQAVPAVRLAAFVDAFPGRSQLTSICNADLSGALGKIGGTAKKLVGDPCLDAPNLADSSPEPGLQPACEVIELRDSAPHAITVLPACGATDCYEIVADPVACPTAPDNLRVRFRRTTAPSSDAWTHVRCQLAP